MVCLASEKLQLAYKDGTRVGTLDLTRPLALRWPAWFPRTDADKQTAANTLKTLVEAGITTATKIAAADYDIEDAAAERAPIRAESRPSGGFPYHPLLREDLPLDMLRDMCPWPAWACLTGACFSDRCISEVFA